MTDIDKVALDVARAIEALFAEFHIGGPTQRLAKIQGVVATVIAEREKALVNSPTLTPDTLASLRKYAINGMQSAPPEFCGVSADVLYDLVMAAEAALPSPPQIMEEGKCAQQICDNCGAKGEGMEIMQSTHAECS